MMDKFAVDEDDVVESRAAEIQKTASVPIADARAQAAAEIENKPRA